MAKDDKKVTVEAELEVNGERVRSHCGAWIKALELPRPVNVTFIGFVRKD